jgi:hypothetical protein
MQPLCCYKPLLCDLKFDLKRSLKVIADLIFKRSYIFLFVFNVKDMSMSQGGTWQLGRYMAGWSRVLEPKRGLPREKGDAQLDKQTVSAAVLLLQPIEIV